MKNEKGLRPVDLILELSLCKGGTSMPSLGKRVR